MAKLRMLKYHFSLILLLSTLFVNAQKDDWQGINIGTDLSRFALPLLDSTRIGWEFSGDYELLPDMFGVFEIGSQVTRLNAKNYDYRSDGIYTRFGVDYNFMRHVDEVSSDKITIGLRYGLTSFSHSAENIRVESELFEDYRNGSIANNWLSAQWLEIAFGMKTKLFNNFYLGWSVRMRMKTWVEEDPLMEPYYIPGYGRASRASNVGLNYTLSYKIPIKKKKTEESK